MKRIKLHSTSAYITQCAVSGFAVYHKEFILIRKLIVTVLLAISFLFYSLQVMSQANTELSNLIAPTKVNVNLQPNTDNSRNLGSDGKSWKDFYLDGYIYLDGARFISNSGGLSNVLVGNLAGNTSMTGAYNSAFGDYALEGSTTGNYNSAFGNYALNENTSGDYNSAFGRNALSQNTVADYNSAFGYTTLTSNTTGYSNSAFGAEALKWNSTGVQNSAFGKSALYENNTGSYNSAFGSVALYDNISGDHNSAFGNGALTFNTTGDYNSAFGDDALTSNTSGSENAAFGREALSNNTVGIKNTAVGNQAGIASTTGNYNSFLGYDAGGSNTTGSQNTYLGYSTESSGSTFTNVVGIGYQVTNTASNQARIGNSSTTSVGGWASWSNVSDGRFKKNVKEDVSGLVFINKLRPVTYNLDVHAADAFVGKEFSVDNDSDESVKISELAKSAKEKIVYSGFIAQEVESAAKEIGYNFSGVDAPKNENDFYGLRYAEFVVPLVKAVQELDQENAILLVENSALQSEVNDLRSRLDRIEAQLGITGVNSNSGNFQRATLQQNIPNPAKNTTVIGFKLPANFSEAQLIISDANGKTIQQFNHLTIQQSSVELSTVQLSSGIYSYTLYVDGNAEDTKQMVIAR